MSSDVHSIRVVQGCSIEVEAHGYAWTMEWDDFVAVGGDGEALNDLPCPGCGTRLQDTDGTLSVGVCLGEHHASVN